MATFVSELSPRPLWAHFDRILATPRPSKKEGAMREYVKEVAARRSLPCAVDAAGNVVVRVPARGGSGPAIALQSHLDMVCEKDRGVAIDFDRDPIVPRREGDWLYATGTTLGSDNGIGVAAMLALVEADELTHPPLELLFTVDEETGLTGAKELDASLLTARTLLNLDTEEEGALYVGCAGGAGTELAVPLETMFGADGLSALEVRLSGFKGGHSGVDIHLQRGNPIRLLARALHALWPAYQFELASFEGGNLTNAIPREAHALLRLGPEERQRFTADLEREIDAVRAELAQVEEGIRCEVVPGSAPAEVFSDATTQRVLALLVAAPHGVLRMSDAIPGLVETSTNLARVRTQSGSGSATLAIHCSNRSSVASALSAAQRRSAALGELVGADVATSEGYPGWKPNLDSPVLAVTRRAVAAVFGEEPGIKAIHAGLECGLIGEKIPGIDMVSFGPQIEFPHSPGERVLIPSVERFWRALAGVLAELARA
jgi:dipeptidase D